MKKTILIKNKKSKKGFSLLELLLVLGIIAALVVAAFIVYPKVQASQRVQAEANNIATIQAGVKALYTSSSSFNGLTTSVGVQAKIFPDNMVSSFVATGKEVEPINVFKGKVTLEASNTGPSATSDSSFNIVYNNVPVEECAKIVTAVAGNFYSVGVRTAGNVKAAGGNLSVSKTASQCQIGGNSNTLIFTSI
ncbi:type 4 pilus major pilin [Klebsiella aerogenes]|uniref:type 4 pilus major pilin n=1 Tax=Klebsiella aerogenes TaxID=548 RepID=UPI0009497B72|nr:type 4 pilus major pilin [Klebsiella aerogenes]